MVPVSVLRGPHSSLWIKAPLLRGVPIHDDGPASPRGTPAGVAAVDEGSMVLAGKITLGRGSGARAWRHGFAAGRYLAGEPGRPGAHQRPGRPGAGDGEAVRLVAGHEDEAARRDGPALLPAEHGHLALQQVEHLVLVGVDVLADREPG